MGDGYTCAVRSTGVTYIATQQGWAYLATIKDLFDGFIIAHRLGRHPVQYHDPVRSRLGIRDWAILYA